MNGVLATAVCGGQPLPIAGRFPMDDLEIAAGVAAHFCCVHPLIGALAGDRVRARCRARHWPAGAALVWLCVAEIEALGVQRGLKAGRA
jgi:hypothetical protein